MWSIIAGLFDQLCTWQVCSHVDSGSVSTLHPPSPRARSRTTLLLPAVFALEIYLPLLIDCLTNQVTATHVTTHIKGLGCHGYKEIKTTSRLFLYDLLPNKGILIQLMRPPNVNGSHR